MLKDAENDPASGIGRRRRAAREEPTKSYVERKQALLSAAAGVFSARGLQAVRMDDVARELDVDRATLYYYFRNKQQLFREVVIEGVTENLAIARKIADGDGRAREKLECLLRSLLDSYDRKYPLFFVYVQEDVRKIASDDSAESQQLVKLGIDYENVVKHIIRQGIDEGEFAPDTHITLTAHAILGAANWTHRWFKPEGELSGDEVGERFGRLFLDGLLVGPARRRRNKQPRRD